MKTPTVELRWATGGLLVLLVGIFLVMRFQASPTEDVLRHSARIESVARLRRDLAAAGEAETSAVLAVTDQESRSYADRARMYIAAVARDRDELKASVDRGGGAKERALLAQFDDAFAELRRIDETIFALAVRNTNLKASALAFGPAQAALNDFDAALGRVLAESALSTSPQAKQIMFRAGDARTAALRIALRLPPHIAEERATRMDELETEMSQDDERVRQDLDVLHEYRASGTELERARSSYERYTELRTQIIALSRENTNVRSMSLSLHDKRKATAACEEALEALELAITEEPVPGLRRSVRPR